MLIDLEYEASLLKDATGRGRFQDETGMKENMQLHMEMRGLGFFSFFGRLYIQSCRETQSRGTQMHAKCFD